MASPCHQAWCANPFRNLLEVMKMSIEAIYRAIMEFDDGAVVSATRAAIDGGAPIESILNDGLIAPMDEVGRRFSEGDLFIPEMLKAAQVMKAGLEVLRPLMSATESRPKGTVVIGTVQGDLHDIGKNLVSMMLEGAGFQVVDLGVDVPADSFRASADEHAADVVALSALLTTTMPAMEAAVTAIKGDGTRKVIVGGAPVTAAFADKIGANGYADDAPGAVTLVRQLAGL